ncbi:MAG: clan AA aspartic protease [Deltaproteobacteria bacterium]|nr:clan AA aspartic protease [Deltaproteobacteria bacterium]
MRTYNAQKRGSLLLIKAFVEGVEGRAYPTLLVDTGSAYTLISQEILESIGCSPAVPKRTQRIITGSGYEIVPVVSVSKFHCLGRLLQDFEVLAHTLPFGVYVDGLLGMDFLGRFEIEIILRSGSILMK